MHQAAQYDERSLNKYFIFFPEIIIWSYSPLRSMLSMLISVIQQRIQTGDIVLKSDNMLAPVLMYQIKGNIIHQTETEEKHDHIVIKLVKKQGLYFILFLLTILLAHLIKTHSVRVLISFEILTKQLWKLKIKISSHWVPIFLVYFTSQTRAKINKMSICRYHKDAIINCIFSNFSFLTVQ